MIRRCLALSGLLWVSTLLAVEGIEFGGGAAVDLIHASSDDSNLVNLDVGAWLEADLGELFGADDFYLFINPTLVWGAEEDWRWRPRLYQAWLKWDGSDHFNALVGVTDLSWHFHSMPSASPFVRLPARTSGEFSPGGIGLLDLYPLSSPTVRIEIKPTGTTYLRAAAAWLSRDHQVRGRELLLDQVHVSQRTIFIAEAGYSVEGDEDDGWNHRLIGVGGWWLPGASDSWGLYAIADAKLWQEGSASAQGLSGFLSISTAKAAGFGQEYRLATGLSYEGLIPGRDDDTTALALILEDPARQACELLHRVKISEKLWAQVSIQWQSGAGKAKQSEWRTGLRLGWDF